ncbi:MAG: PepSY domain-containing protein [Bacteroidota bacterium]
MNKKKRKKQAKLIRRFRKIHRYTGVLLFVFFFVIAVTSLLLGWKKHSQGTILPPTYKGINTDVTGWLPLDSLQTIAFQALKDSVDTDIDLALKKMDVRPAKGMVKFIFDNHYWGVQIDCTTGQVLAVTRRNSDLIENIHDGSILDIVFNTKGEIIKLSYTTLMSLALLVFVVTGFWLWYGPKRIKKSKRS